MNYRFQSKTLYLAMLIAFSSLVASQCNDGCLKCEKIDSNSSLCNICDIMASYVPFGVGLCLKMEVEGCEIPTADRAVVKCVQCVAGSIFDTTTGKCKEVTTKIEGCLRYNANAECASCKIGMYIKEKGCVSVETATTDCAVYGGDPLACVWCKAGFYLKQSDKTCVAIAKVTNCLAYSRTDCLNCKTGYIVNPNFSLLLDYTNEFIQGIASSSVRLQAGEPPLVDSNVNNCQKTTVKNCAKFETFDKCSTCMNEYFLMEEGKKCEHFPQNPIPNCQVYSNATTCLTCVNGSYHSPPVCKSSTQVKDCHTYSQVIDECTTCEYGFYKAQSTCTKRENSLVSNQCKTPHPTLDKCQDCNPNFILNTNQTGCLAEIPFCETNNVSSENVVSCGGCSTGYGDLGGICSKQNIDNCTQYKTGLTTCETCKDNFYSIDSFKECVPNNVEFCKVKNKLLHECTTCETNFYKKVDGTCVRQDVPNCVTFVNNENNCGTCQFGYFKTILNKCDKRTATECETPTDGADTCDKCNPGFYPDQPFATKCKANNMSGCLAFVANENNCSTCTFPGFWNSSGTCTAHNDVKCSIFETNSARCATCKATFYADMVTTSPTYGTCLDQDRTFCSEHKSNLNECKNCNSLHKYNVDGNCTPLTANVTTAASCIQSTLNQDVCEVCAKNYVKTSDTVCTARSTITTKIDNLCTGNANSTDDGTCSGCANNFMSFAVEKYQWVQSLGNCEKINFATGACLQCKSGFFGNGTATCNVTVLSNNICQQNKENFAAQIQSTLTNCAVCKEGYYSESTATFACNKRSAIGLNCDEAGLGDDDTCTYCAEGSVYSDLNNITTCSKKFHSVDKTVVSSCLIYSLINPGECILCKSQLSGTTCGTDPTQPDYFINGFNTSLELTPFMLSVDTQIPGCGSYSISQDNKVTCATCSSLNAFVGIYKTSTQTFFGSTFGTVMPKSPFMDDPALYGGCIADASINSLTKQSGSTYPPILPSSAYSDMAYFFQSADGTIGLSCKENKKPTISTGTKQSDGATDVTTKYVHSVVGCSVDADGYGRLKKRYKGLSYLNNNSNKIPYSAMILHDSCELDTQLFVFYGYKNTSSAHEIIIGSVGSDVGNSHCHSNTTKDNAPHTPIANCQVNFMKLDTLSDPADFENTARSPECLACKPGYAALYTSTNINITSCTAIANCDMTNEDSNTWMGACQTCKASYAWTYKFTSGVSNEYQMKYHMCVSTTATNCLAIDEDTPNNCVICKKGYTLNNSKQCVELKIEGCKKLGIARIFENNAKLTTAITDTSFVQSMTALVHYVYLEGNSSIASLGPGCLECESTDIAFNLNSATASTKYCTGTKSFYSTIDNCKNYKVDASNNHCYICNDNYIVDEAASHTCASNSIVANKYCLSKNGANCTRCIKGTPVSNVCKEYKGCETITGNKCTLCQEGWKPTDDYDCEAISGDDTCSQYAAKNICVKCKTTGESPVNYLDSSDAATRSFCVVKYSGTGTSASQLVNAVYAIKPTAANYKTKYFVHDIFISNKNIIANDMSIASSANYSVCIPSPTTEFCSTYDDFKQCTACNSGYVLDTTSKLCKIGPVLNCITYAPDNTTCNKCNTGFFVKSNKCENRVNKNCKTYTDNLDTCVDCNDGNYFKTGECKQHTVENCLTYKSDANECTDCVNNVRFLSPSTSNTCELYTVKYCKTFIENANECTDCFSNRYKSSSTKDCELYTVNNCDPYDITKNECTTCKTGFFKDTSNNCLPPQAKFCDVPNSTQDMCDSCTTGYYLKIESLKPNLCDPNTSVNCATKSKTENRCETCLPAHWKDASFVCNEHSAVFCSSYKADENKCNECLQGYYTDANGICILNTTSNCEVKSIIANGCATCKVGYFKSTGDQCAKVTNSTCVEILKNTNNCSICKSTRYSDSVSGECKDLTTIDNCNVYASNLDQCSACNSGYYKSVDSQNCFTNPNGIQNCAKYSDLTNCEMCDPTHYLSSNKCLEVTVANIKAKCSAYSGDGICSHCEANYSLTTNDPPCESNVATGCLTWKDKDNCETCLPNQLLTGAPALCKNTSLSGCAVTSGSDGSEKCLACIQTSFLKDGECTVSTKTITDCLVYSAEGICSKCNNKIVSSDGSACNDLVASKFGENCADGSLHSSPKCVLCTGGFLIDGEGKCSISCEASNCQLCDPIDQKKCNLCNTGYHMTDKLVCEVNNQTIAEGTRILGMNVLLLLVVLLFMERN